MAIGAGEFKLAIHGFNQSLAIESPNSLPGFSIPFDLIETLEDVGQVFLADARIGVADKV